MRLESLLIFYSLLSSAWAQDLQSILQVNEDLSFFAEAITTSGLLDQLSTSSDITVLAPSNDAFVRILEELSGNLDARDFVTALLRYHVLDGRYSSNNITEAGSPFLSTLLTYRDFVNIKPSTLRVLLRMTTSQSTQATIYHPWSLSPTWLSPKATSTSLTLLSRFPRTLPPLPSTRTLHPSSAPLFSARSHGTTGATQPSSHRQTSPSPVLAPPSQILTRMTYIPY